MYSSILITALLPFLAAAATPCTVGNDTPCFPSSTCTPTMISTSGKPWLGQCIATPTPQAPASSPPILSYPPVSMPASIKPPPASMPSAISFPPVSMPTPVSMECNVGAGTGCNTGSTCTPTQTCYRLRPCGGKCVATATTQPSATSAPVMSYPPVSMPTPVAECMVGWADNGCAVGTTCEPIETCYRLRPCKGKCMAASKTPLPSYPPASMPSAISYSPVPMPTPVDPDCSSAPAVSHPPVSMPSPISIPPMPMPTPVDPECSYPPVSMPSSISFPPKPMPTPEEPDCSSVPIISHPPVSMPSPISIPPVSMPSAQPPAECMVGWADTGCKSGFSCEPVETCYRLRPCRGKCVAKVTSSPVLSYPMPTATFAPSSMVTCYRG